MNMSYGKRVFCALLLLSLWGCDDNIASLEASILRIVVQNASGLSAGAGFVVSSEGHVLTTQQTVGLTDDVLVIHTGFSKQGGERSRAGRVIWRSAVTDLAVIQVNGLSLPPLDLQDEFKTGAPVHLLKFPGTTSGTDRAEGGLSPGTVNRLVGYLSLGVHTPYIQHTAEMEDSNKGSPLLDECGAVVGVNTAKAIGGGHVLDSSGTARVNLTEGEYFAINSKAVISELEQQGIPISRSSGMCLSWSKSSQAMILPTILVCVALFGLLLMFRQNRRILAELTNRSRLVIRSSVQPAFRQTPYQQKTPRHVLSLGNGEQIFSISQQELQKVGRGGVVVGRKPGGGGVTIEDDAVSVRHLRIWAVDDSVSIEDMDSTNGTYLEGERLDPWMERPLYPNQILKIGTTDLCYGVTL